ncbi:hypothetical protein KVR01_011253 [Diaporthe batatas]|uniref:uncharacterized protein n=1 Tax=Diaporthe batatas TaxID=748121 RepID=UPI001D0503A5|nr:uncharacterized protein KVR01_011253 [Diaporthe batatas]KAG8158810.1 hypothetical protein KVR01_011253 [Diaporthe batatas]
MSSFKRKATTSTPSTPSTTTARSSGSRSNNINSGTRVSRSRAGSTRMRTRSQAKAQCPQTPKRPRPRHEILQDDVFAIKDIIDEKFIRGRLHYRIDWEDDPRTGGSFLPTWEPAENASEDAVTDWEKRKQRRTRLSTCSEDITDLEASEASTPGDTPAQGIFVELQSKSDFLRSRPDFNPSDVVFIPSSQLSHFPDSGSQIELPPSQFFIASSHPSLDLIADSQPVDPVIVESQQTQATNKHRNFSQTTIPDSQDFSTDLSHHHNSVSFTGQVSNPPSVAHVRRAAAQHPSFASSIPSRQPGTVLGSFGTHSIPGWEEEDSSVEDDQHAAQPEYSQVEGEVSRRPVSSLEGFLTQGDSQSGNYYMPGGSGSQFSFNNTASQSQQPSNTLAEATPTEDSQQAAQIVSPLAPRAPVFHTQNEEDFFTASEDNYEIVAPPERSAIEELRAIQEAFIPGYQNSTGVDNTVGGSDPNAPPSPVSPSAILNSVEQDSVENLHHSDPSLPPMDPASWVHGASSELFSDGIGPQHDSSMMNTTVTPLKPPATALGEIEELDLPSNALKQVMGASLEEGSDVPATVTPSALFTSMDLNVPPDLSLRPDGGLHEEAEPVVASSEVQDDSAMLDDLEILPAEDSAPNEYIIPIPPAARIRAEVLDYINQHRQEIHEFSTNIYGNAQSTDHKNAAKIDGILQHLTELSNLPPYHKDLPDLSQEEMVRYARDTSSKLSFVYELLQGLRDVAVEIAVLAQGGTVLEQLEAIVSQGGFVYRHLHGSWPQAPTGQHSACRVVLIDTSIEDAQFVHTANIVLAYDQTAEHSGLLHQYKTDSLDKQQPLVFSLVEVYTLEHINRRLSPAMGLFERQRAQTICLAFLSTNFEDEWMYERIPQPYEMAQDLIRYLVDGEGRFTHPETRWETWRHQTVPEDIFDRYKAFRARYFSAGSRKRRLSEGDDVPDTPKRARIESPPEISDDLRRFLGKDATFSGDTAQVSIEKLEDLVLQAKDLKAALDKKGAELRGWVKTVRTFHPKYQQAIRDRNIFEEERDKMFKEKERVQKALELSQAKATKLSEEKQELAAKLQELANLDNPDTAAAAQRELDIASSREMAAGFEKQLAFLRKDVEYARGRYQDASDQAAMLVEDNKTLKSRVAELEVKASDNAVKLRGLSVDAARSDALRLLKEERERRQSAERELERKNDELRGLKSRFGGRETRGSSVPRSPRVRQMSSRNTSPVGDNGNGGNGGNGGGVGGGGGPGPISGVFGPRSTHLKENF